MAKKNVKSALNKDSTTIYMPSSPSTSSNTFQNISKSPEKAISAASSKKYIGQSHIMGENAILRKILDKNETPSMILWSPPGVCKQTQNTRFVKLSVTMAGVNDIKQAVAAAKNEQKFGRKTILFMDEIHRFNKLQKDIFLPHVESGAITLIGATTENPSFSLSSVLLSRCWVIVLEKLTTENICEILKRSLKEFEAIILNLKDKYPSFKELGFTSKVAVDESSIKWHAEICDGDARITLNSLQLAMESLQGNKNGETKLDLIFMQLSSIKDGIKRSHMLYDKQGDQHYDMISALHKSIRASNDNAALYSCSGMIVAGIKLHHCSSSSLLSPAPKCRAIYHALSACKADINNFKGPESAKPLHLRNAPTKSMRDLNYGKGNPVLNICPKEWRIEIIFHKNVKLLLLLFPINMM